ncbi:MAG: hypothetical protein IT385_16535 [Deltaproteobacteria bacterium]|nr:hypothetical protein [Deltaproteobacteria bacterium]
MTRTSKMLGMWVVGVALVSGACGASRPLVAHMEPMRMEQAPTPPPVLTENHFKRDIMGDLDERQLREILVSPVFLEDKARIGILPVSSGYESDPDMPLDRVPGGLEKALSDSGHFEVVSEVTTDWPHASTLGGLRELAARYRAEYLLLYRSRFVTRSHANAWALGWVTIVGGLILPHRTIEVAGVMEATLLDVKTGTLLFTAFERTYTTSDENVWQNDRKRVAMKEELRKKGMKTLTAKVLDQVGRLAAARPAEVVPPAVPARVDVRVPEVVVGEPSPNAP